MNFYAVIIGTEILNGRREDAHFEFVKKELQKYGHELFSSFVIKDDATLMTKVYEMIKEDKDAVIFSFGGIGSTPDDLTREIASKVFTNAELVPHEQFLEDIESGDIEEDECKELIDDIKEAQKEGDTAEEDFGFVEE